MEKKPRSRFTFFLLISLLFHILAVTTVLLWLKRQPAPALEKMVVVQLHPKKLDIADIPKPAKEERPDEADKAALYDQKVKQEQVAKTLPAAASAPKQKQRNSPSKAPRSPKSFAERFSTGALPEDFYPDYKVGNHTYVNALRYPNIAYFVELKRRFKTAFNPVPVIRQHANQITQGKIDVVLGVSVNARGELAELIVLQASPIAAYDDVARRTVERSAPFSAPPLDLLDSNSKLLRMSWTFTVYL